MKIKKVKTVNLFESEKSTLFTLVFKNNDKENYNFVFLEYNLNLYKLYNKEYDTYLKNENINELLKKLNGFTTPQEYPNGDFEGKPTISFNKYRESENKLTLIEKEKIKVCEFTEASGSH